MTDTTQLELKAPAHNNQHLFSDHYLNEVLPQNTYWQALESQSQELLERASALLDGFNRSNNERQTEEELVIPLLKALGHTFELQATLKTSDGNKTPDYVFYADKEAQSANKGKILNDELPKQGGIAVGDAKSWGRSLDTQIKENNKDALSNKIPAYQIWFYMLHSGVDWGILTNGKKWRLYEKSTAQKLDHFYEVDIEELVAENDPARFLYFYALFRREAFDEGNVSLAEILRGSAEYARKVGDSLKEQVYEALKHISQGFLDYAPNNLQPDADTLKVIYDNSLILLYRLLFILYAEARELLPVKESRQYRDIYSLHAIKNQVADELQRKIDLLPDSARHWAKLKDLFRHIDKGYPPLKISTFNGGLFDPNKHVFLDQNTVGDAHLQQAIDKLARVDGAFVDYRDLTVQHMGTIYEGLLEYHIQPLNAPEDGWDLELINDKGERKATGSYYTPDYIVKYIVEHTVGPVLEKAIAEKKTDDERLQAILEIDILDPAMGSGHFLVEATEFTARFLVDLGVAPKGKTQEEADITFWKRRVAQSCIYGVDLNPLAVELAKLSLWLTTVAKDRPLSFLDHHLRPGNSLVGARLEHLELVSASKKSKAKKKTDQAEGQISLFGDSIFTQRIGKAVNSMWLIEETEAANVDQVKEQEQLYEAARSQFVGKYSRLLNLVTATRFGVPVDEWLWGSLVKYASDSTAATFPAFEKLMKQADEVADRERFFHWELEFPEVYFDKFGRPLGDEAGFEAVIGNPPWERIKLQENEFFARLDRDIAHAPKAADRKKMIAELPKKKPDLWKQYEIARASAENLLAYVQKSGFYPMMGRGDTNLYAVFAERALQLMANTGRTGILTPSGIATDDTTKLYFQHLVNNKMLAELWDFENREKVFPDVDSRFKFSIVLITGEGNPQEKVQCGFFLHNMRELSNPERRCSLASEDFRLFNPNTLTCPIFRRRVDAILTRKIYSQTPVLIDKNKGKDGNPWGIKFSTMFHMTNDSHLFKTAEELEKDGLWLGEGNIYHKGEIKYLPLYEGKMVQMYDHRAATIIINPENLHRPAQPEPVGLKQHMKVDYLPSPQFWVKEHEISSRRDSSLRWTIGFKDIASPTNERTVIMAALPAVGFSNKIPLVISTASSDRYIALLSNFNSIVLDYAARQKVGGQTLNFFIVEQFPILPPDTYESDFQGTPLLQFIKDRVLELCYTAYDLKGFAEDMGYEGEPFTWDEERRLHLRCQLDALYFHLYGLSREEAGEILDTFPIVSRQDVEKYGNYRTKDLIIAYYNAYAAGDMDAWVKG